MDIAKKLNLTRREKGLLLGLLVAVLGFASMSVAKAAIPNSSTGQINACYRNNANLFVPKGNLRVIDAQNNETCTGQETALNWQSQGSSQIISNRIIVPSDQINSQTVLAINNFGEIRVDKCSEINSVALKFVNTTSRNLETPENYLIAPNEEIPVFFNSQSGPSTLILSYRESNTNHYASVTGGFSVDFAYSSDCVFFAQSITSQN